MNISAISAISISSCVAQTKGNQSISSLANNDNNSDTFKRNNNISNQPSFKGKLWKDLWDLCVNLVCGDCKVASRKVRKAVHKQGAYYRLSENQQGYYDEAEETYNELSDTPLPKTSKEDEDFSWF